MKLGEITLNLSDADENFIRMFLLPKWSKDGVSSIEGWVLFLIMEHIETERQMEKSLDTLKDLADTEQERCNCDHGNDTFEQLPIAELQRICTFLCCKCNLDSSISAIADKSELV